MTMKSAVSGISINKIVVPQNQKFDDFIESLLSNIICHLASGQNLSTNDAQAIYACIQNFLSRQNLNFSPVNATNSEPTSSMTFSPPCPPLPSLQNQHIIYPLTSSETQPTSRLAEPSLSSLSSATSASPQSTSSSCPASTIGTVFNASEVPTFVSAQGLSVNLLVNALILSLCYRNAQLARQNEQLIENAAQLAAISMQLQEEKQQLQSEFREMKRDRQEERSEVGTLKEKIKMLETIVKQQGQSATLLPIRERSSAISASSISIEGTLFAPSRQLSSGNSSFSGSELISPMAFDSGFPSPRAPLLDPSISDFSRPV